MLVLTDKAGKSTTLRRRLLVFVIAISAEDVVRIPAVVHTDCIPGRTGFMASGHSAEHCAIDPHDSGCIGRI